MKDSPSKHRERPTTFSVKELYDKGFERKKSKDPSNTTLNNEWKQELDCISSGVTAIKATLEGGYYGKNASSKNKTSHRNFIQENKLTLGLPAKINTFILNKKLERKIREEQGRPESVQKHHKEYFKYSKSLYEHRSHSAPSYNSAQRI